jgi:hypothetical protein
LGPGNLQKKVLGHALHHKKLDIPTKTGLILGTFAVQIAPYLSAFGTYIQGQCCRATFEQAKYIRNHV